MRIKILSDAEDDLIEGFCFYEKQQSSLGREFLDHLNEEILDLPNVCGIRSKRFDYYRAVVQTRFPFAIYYRFENDVIYIHAIFDCRKDPQAIKASLGGRK